MIGGFSIDPLARLSTPAGFFKLTRAGLTKRAGEHCPCALACRARNLPMDQFRAGRRSGLVCSWQELTYGHSVQLADS